MKNDSSERETVQHEGEERGRHEKIREIDKIVDPALNHVFLYYFSHKLKLKFKFKLKFIR